MTLWHASTELLTAATAVAKTAYRAAGLGLDAALWLEVEAGLEDTSG